MQIAKHPLLWSLLIALGLSHAAWAQAAISILTTGVDLRCWETEDRRFKSRRR